MKAYKLRNSRSTKNTRKRLRRNMTKSEVIMWNALKGKQIGYKFRRQYSIGKFIVDFFCAELNLILEIDGTIHGEGDNPDKDKSRESYFKKFGFRIKRYSNEQVLKYTDTIYVDLKEYCDKISKLKPSPNPSLEGRGV